MTRCEMCNDPLEPHETVVCDDCDAQLAAATDTTPRRRAVVAAFPVTTATISAINDVLGLMITNGGRDELLVARERFQAEAEACHQDHAPELIELIDTLLLNHMERHNG